MRKPNALRPAEHYITHWHHTAEPGVTISDVLVPDYWAHVARQLQPHSRVIVDAQDGTWTATLFVRSATRLDAAMSVISHVQFDAAPKLAGTAADEYEIGWGGPAHRHRVVRKSDREVMRHGFATQDEAVLWLKGHVATLNAA